MINTLLTVAYDGTNYGGFQIQENAFTIQEALEKALGIVYKKAVRVTAAGRTDSGVHARGQAVSFRAPFGIDDDSLPHALNCLLPADIVVTGAVKVEDAFHARFDAIGKTYSYTIDRAKFPQIMMRLYSWHMPDPLDLNVVKKAASMFVGTHDFKYFQSAGGKVTDTVRTIYRAGVEEQPDRCLLVLTYEGNGFLYRMIRRITGTLIQAGKGDLALEDISEALKGSNPGAVAPTAPARGLCLEKVLYQSGPSHEQ